MTNPTNKTPITPEEVLKSIGDIVYFQSTDGSLHIINNASENILGFTQDELNKNISWKTLMHPDDLNCNEEFLQKRPPSEKEHIVYCRVRHKNGHWVRLESRLFSVLNAKKEVIGYHGVARDVTKQFAIENELRNKNEQLKNTIKSVPGAVYKVNGLKMYNFEFMSNQIKQITGYKAESFLNGKINYDDLIIENDREMTNNFLKKAMDNHSEFELSYRITSKYGKEKWIWEKGVFTTYGEKPVREGFLMDITDRIKQEDRIISATLQAEDAERRRIVKEIHDGVQQTLVSSLMGLQSLEKYFEKSVTDQSIARQYKTALKRLQQGVNETTNIAHSIMPKSIQDFGLVKTIEGMINALRRHSEIAFSFYQNLGDYRLNNKVETCFYRITQEAINNVIKYSQATEAIIQLMQHDDIVTLTIEDNGKGFDVNEKNLLYTGLGISSMKSRASAVGAGIEITSQPGKGTNILVEIQLKETL